MQKYLISVLISVASFGLLVYLLKILTPFNEVVVNDLIKSYNILVTQELVTLLSDLLKRGLILEYLNLRNVAVLSVLFCLGVASGFVTLHLIIDKLLFKSFYQKANYLQALRRGAELFISGISIVLFKLIAAEWFMYIAALVLILSLEVILTRLLDKHQDKEATTISYLINLINNKKELANNWWLNLVTDAKMRAGITSDQNLHTEYNQPMNNNAYFTTPIFYPTGNPHIGTAYNVFITDLLARHARQSGRETFFTTGIDEHGGNIQKKAEEKDITPQHYVDEYAQAYEQTWETLGINYDYFVRTTNPQHQQFVQQLIQKSFDAGDIYEGKYEGWYCESCEAYYTDKDLVDGKCPNHPLKEAIWTSEKNYFFKLSAYQDWLKDYYQTNPDFVKPEKWSSYVQDLIAAGLQDIPVTRANVKWGIPVPFDQEQTIYVWYDALPNYLSTLNFKEFADYEAKFWPNATHVVGKDILKFHAILWPAMLKSAGYALPKNIITHGFFTINNQKIGKSNNNATSITSFTNKYGVDAVRYALLSEFQIGNDGDFSEDRLKVKYETELAGKYGNLINRVIHLLAKLEIKQETALFESAIAGEINQALVKFNTQVDSFQIYESCQTFIQACEVLNKYVNDCQPWKLPVLEAVHELQQIEAAIINLNKIANILLPETSKIANLALSDRQSVILFPKLED